MQSDNLSPEDRRKAMRAVRSTGTSPELRVAAALDALGVEYERHGNLPGRPDFVIPSRRLVLLVHGCFWHRHACGKRVPKTNREYWEPKLRRNVRRDRRVRQELNQCGWSVAVLWECGVRTDAAATAAVEQSLRRARSARSVASRAREGSGS